MTHWTSEYGETSCDYIAEIFDLDSSYGDYMVNSEIYLSNSDVLKLYGYFSINILKNSTQINMKKIIYIIALLIGATTMAQTITVNGTPMLVSDDISFPFWLESGSSISPEVPVSSISVLEFNIVPNNNGNDMVFNQVISVTEGQTVPEGKTWKVESILMENQSFL